MPDLIDLYLEAGLTEEAAGLLEPLQRTQQKNLRVRRQSAIVALQRRQLPLALEILRKLHTDYPQDRTILTDLAFAEDQAKHPKRAMELYARVLDGMEGRP